MRRCILSLIIASVVSIIGISVDADAQSIVPGSGLPDRSKGESAALLIGIDQYNTRHFPPLKHAAKEMSVLANILRQSGYKEVSVLSDEKATRSNIIRQLKMIMERQTSDRLLVYFSGHGLNFSRLMLELNKNADSLLIQDEFVEYNKAVLENRQLDFLYLGVYQTKKNRFTEAIGAHEIVEILNQPSVSGKLAHQRVFIIDACYSGALENIAYLPLEIYNPKIVEDGFYSLVGPRLRRNEDGKLGDFFNKGLLGAADKIQFAGNRDAKISFFELAIYLNDELSEYYLAEHGLVYKMRFTMIGSGNLQLLEVQF